MKATQILHDIGQSIWLDNISRDFPRSGRLIAIACLMAACAFAQKAESHLPVTDPEKVADALRAGPTFITKDATLLDWPAVPGGEYRILRKGSNEWTCLPSIPGYPHDEPGCFDPAFLQWIQDSMAGRMPHIDRIGIAYMYVGVWAKEADGFFLAGGEKKSGKGGKEFHVGPHLMIVSPHQDDFQGLNRDASDGMPYVTHLSGRTELFLVMPIRQWNEQ